MRYLSLYLGKMILLSMRLVGRRGAALPGLVVEKLNPGFMSNELSRLPGGVIIVTGTNGKTTSTKMLSSVLGSEKKVLTNATGSNFVRGIIASLIEHTDWAGRLNYDVAVFELDEAHAVKFVERYSPRGVLVLNVMRDQMDRFGEIDETARLIKKVVEKATDFVVLNRDDPRVYELKNSAKGTVVFFGINKRLSNLFVNDDELHSPAAVKNNKQTAHVVLERITDKYAQFTINDRQFNIELAALSTFNAINAAAVIATAAHEGIKVDKITSDIQQVPAAFGRGERIIIDEHRSLVLQLVKNPGGFRQAILSNPSKNKSVMIAINDEYADGRDVSWLWDVDFSDLCDATSVMTSGVRAADMALRLAYEEVPVSTIEDDLDAALATFVSSLSVGKEGILYCTYTAMLALRRSLSRYTDIERIL